MRMVVDAFANGTLISKSYNEAYEIIERIASDNYQWLTNQATSRRRVVGIHEVDALTSLTSQVYSISSMLKNLTTNGSNSFVAQPPNQFENIDCVYYGEGHLFEECPSNPEFVYYMGNQNQNQGRQGLQSNFYNSSWRNHPNFSWSNQGAGTRKEHCKALTLRNGKTVESNTVEVGKEQVDAQDSKEVQPSVEIPFSLEPKSAKLNKVTSRLANSDQLTMSLDVELPPNMNQPESVPVIKPPPPNTQRLHMNIPLVEALEQMPNYVKFMKDILSKK
ncbi:uncharacterized protein LOC105793346 [Gossypium raimondii]|uniref:uncharacterized protein LOC105793346 n=1 Tax=Gossypium raimondii TaxID=29730 RepID=UPI00063AD739|nr:uncharacterized protein LOC105793346 [Gossypium raimondii]